ncbi:CYTH and CHAD domain-containing protein [uncultured Streptomyces sp.]|uniref:CYTH and CHAD domain-containing protein n=1 Tax=uncultured Streptomyces sp. TaxID=174707 RepID=UPI002623185C|nr:CYTH and CHAD domain-containing protein [uncultured Streptomyces sp.]
MADVKREIERKFEADPGAQVPDLTGTADVAAVAALGVTELDAVYYDTDDLRLAADSVTLRRRTGGSDAGWHVKFPVAAHVRDEIGAPLSDTLPDSLAALLRSRVRGADLRPTVRLLSARDVHHLRDADGCLLAELSVDAVVAERLAGPGAGTTAAWTEIEVELADDGDPALLDAVAGRLAAAGVRPSGSHSKLARALAETTPAPKGKPRKPGKPGKPERRERASAPTAGDHVLAYVREQVEAIVALDPAVRRELPDSVHRMRVATRRLRSAFKSFRAVLDRSVTDLLGDELKWLAGELGVGRDQEVLEKRLDAAVEDVPDPLLLGPVRARLRLWSAARRADSRARVVGTLDGERYLALLDTLVALLDEPPLLPAAGRSPDKVLAKAARKEFGRLADRVALAGDRPPGHERDLALHEARKAAKRARYAGEAARPALGKPAKRFTRRMKEVQSLLGDHQDSVVARDALRDLAVGANEAGESSFTWGLLYAREEAGAAARERELPGVWSRAAAPGARAALKS